MAVARSHSSDIVSLPRASAGSVQTKSPAFLPSAAKSVETSAIERQERDSYSVTALADITDRSLHAGLARFTGGLSPAAIGSAYLDWAVHLAGAPGKRMQLFDKAVRKSIRFANYATRCALEGTLYRTAVAGSPFRWRELADLAVQFHFASIPSAAAMVAQRHGRRARCLKETRGHARVRVAPTSRHDRAIELYVDQSGNSRAHDHDRRT
jgi:Poly-beta-hydroxybutyrate polymerase N terminal